MNLIKLSWIQINIQKSAIFLYTNNELLESELRKQPYLHNPYQKNKLPEYKSKEIKDLYQKTLRYWWKKLKITSTDRKTYHVYGLEIIKIITLPKAIYRVNEIPIKIINSIFFYFYRNWTSDFKNFLCSHKRFWIAKTVLKKENRGGSIVLLEFRLY